MARAKRTEKLAGNLTLREMPPHEGRANDSWWLSDRRAGMFIAMGAPTREAALVAGLEYWAVRALKAHARLQQLDDMVAIIRQELDVQFPREE